MPPISAYLWFQPFDTDHERAIAETVDVVAQNLRELFRNGEFQRGITFAAEGKGLAGWERGLEENRERLRHARLVCGYVEGMSALHIG